jgi:hypothetical protein
MNSEKCVWRAWHSDSTMAISAGLMRKPLISVFFHFDSFDRSFSFVEFRRLIGRQCLLFIVLLDGHRTAEVFSF